PETLDLSFHLSLDLELFLALDPRRRSKVMRTKFAIAVLALACAARAADDLQLQEATGQAAVLNGDKPAAREKAIDDALRQAVKMAVGTQVQSVTEVQEFQTKMDTVLEHSTGYVKRYEILKEGMDGDVVQVTVRAQVSLAALDKDLEALGLLMARKNFPRTMVLIAEQNIGMAAPARPWVRNEVVSADLRVAENVVLDELRQRGFRQLVDAGIATGASGPEGTPALARGRVGRQRRARDGAQGRILARRERLQGSAHAADARRPLGRAAQLRWRHAGTGRDAGRVHRAVRGGAGVEEAGPVHRARDLGHREHGGRRARSVIGRRLLPWAVAGALVWSAPRVGGQTRDRVATVSLVEGTAQLQRGPRAPQDVREGS